MSRDVEVCVPPRLANVSAALFLGADSLDPDSDDAGRGGIAPESQRLAEELSLLFEDVLIVGGPARSASMPGRHLPLGDGLGAPLDGIIAALEAAREARVLLLMGDQTGVTVDLLLALTAWPEHDVVAPRSRGRVWECCALYRRLEVLAKARAQLRRDHRDVASLLATIDSGFIEGDDLAALISNEN